MYTMGQMIIRRVLHYKHRATDNSWKWDGVQAAQIGSGVIVNMTDGEDAKCIGRSDAGFSCGRLEVRFLVESNQ